MSEWLTIGQLIDQLLIGQIAESDDKQWKVKWGEASSTLTFMDGISDNYAIELQDKKRKWRILPTYVPFAEAMKALKEGKTIVQHLDDPKWKYRYDGEYILTWYFNVRNKWESWEQCNGKGALCSLEGKWTVEN